MQHSERPVWRSRARLASAITVAVALFAISLLGVDRPEQAWMPLAALVVIVSAAFWATARRERRERRIHEERLTVWAAERAAQEERLRIARELHDLASHGLGLITVRAAAAARAAGDDSDAERTAALRDIERTGREATTELRRMLAVLRSRDGGAALLRPAETLADLPGILAVARETGLEVEARLPDPDELGAVSPGVQLAVCAIAREALTNAARHAGPTAVSVALERSSGEVVVEIRDRGAAACWAPAPGAGFGLLGLRERVTALGGRLETGPTASGFRVLARIPDRSAS